ncbi:MAG TPA: hypothetical protein QGF35_04230 [Dehalococcoidia bacterium]|nr:hypothetical protein [Dehalococcoidia bacterium]
MWLKWTAVGLVVGAIFSVVWWALIDPITDDGVLTELEIPAGTAAAIAAGESATFVPNNLVLASNRKLTVRNLDSVDHQVGEFTVSAGGVAVISTKPDANQLSCTFHPSGSLGVGITERPNLALMVLPTVLIGFPLGLVGSLVSLIGSKLDTGQQAPRRVERPAKNS